LPHADGNAHVFGEPAFGARLIARDSERVALLAEQRIAAVARAVAHDRELLGEVHDVAAFGIELARRVQAFDEGLVLFDAFQGRFADARHEIHVRDDVSAVRDLDAAARVGGVDGPHAVRDHVHRAAAHATREARLHEVFGFRGRLPIVVRPGVDLIARADERQVLDACDVLGIGAVQIAAGVGRLVELEERATVEHLVEQLAIFWFGALAPVDPVGAGQFRDFRDPVAKALQARGHGWVDTARTGKRRSIACTAP